MRILIFKKLKAGWLIFLDRFKNEEKTFQERHLTDLEIGRPIVVRQPNEAYVILTNGWENHQKGEELKVYGSVNSDFQANETTFLKTVVDVVISINRPSNQRSYFIIENENGKQVRIGERLIPFKGTINFRDVGGYPTKDGKQVKWGKIYRSGHLRKLRKSNFYYFNKLKIRTICDFRGEEVAKKIPDNLPPNHGIKVNVLSVVSQGLEMKTMLNKIVNDDLEDFDGKAILSHSYRAFVTRTMPQFKIALSAMMKNETPVLYHCTAGKDRTGFIIALVLSLLGVDRDLIFKDFLASNYFRKKETEKYNKIGGFFTDMNRLTPLMEVDADFLKGAFEEIKVQYGSVENYVITRMEFSEKEVKEMKKRYVE